MNKQQISINKLRLSEVKCKNGQCLEDLEGILVIKIIGRESIIISCFCAKHEKEVEDIIKKVINPQ